MTAVNKTLSQVARQYVGETETTKNLDFTHPLFKQKMIDVGWSPGLAWCSFFGEICAKESRPDLLNELSALCHGSAVQTLKNFEKAGYIVHKDKPVADCLVVWQLYVDGVVKWEGHMGVVEQAQGTTFISIEGNTDDGKSKDRDNYTEREGYIVAVKTHRWDTSVPSKGRKLVPIGCIELNKKSNE